METSASPKPKSAQYSQEHVKDPKSGTWNSLMPDKPYDESSALLVPASSSSSSPKNLREAWWAMVIQSSSSSEEEISSIDSIPINKPPSGVEKDKAEKVDSQEVGRQSHDGSRNVQVNTPSSPRETREYPEDEETGFGGCCNGGRTKNLLDLVQQNTCSYDTINSPALRKLEQTFTDRLSGLGETHSLWKLLDPMDFEEFEDWSPSDEDSESFDMDYPLEPVTKMSDMTDEILKDMERDYNSIHQKSEVSGAKYKNILSQKEHNSTTKNAKLSKSASDGEGLPKKGLHRAVKSSEDLTPIKKRFGSKREAITPKAKAPRLVSDDNSLQRKVSNRNTASSSSKTDHERQGFPWKKGSTKPKVNMTRMATSEASVLKEVSKQNAATSSDKTDPVKRARKKETATQKEKTSKLSTGEASERKEISKHNATAFTDENHTDKRGSPWKKETTRAETKPPRTAADEADVLKEVSKQNITASSEERTHAKGRSPPSKNENTKTQAIMSPEDDESTKPSYIPSSVAIEDSNLASPTRLVNGMSNLTTDSVKTDLSSWHQHFHDENQSKRCFSPSFHTFQKRLGMLNKLKTKKKTKSMSTGSASQITGGSLPTVRVMPKPGSETVELGVETNCYEYDYDSTSHTYTAYFSRGETARNSFRLYEHQTPQCFPTLRSEIVVRVEVSTVSSSDCAVRRGDWWGEGSRHPLNLPIVPGTAFCGRIVQIDKAWSRHGLHKGDRVTSLVRVGANTRHLCIDSDRVVKVPQDLTDEIAVACLAEVYLAAFQALHLGKKNAARYRKTALSGKSVLVLDGATAQGRALIELAAAAGASTIFSTGREKQFEMIEDAGGLPLNKNPNHWFALLKGRIDLVVGHESVCSQLDIKYEHIQSLNPTGKLVLIGSPDQEEKTVITLDKLDKQTAGTTRKLHNFNVFDSWDADIKLGKRDLTHLLKLLQDGSVKPRILDRIPLNKVANAQDLIESRKLSGFILCEPWIKCSKKESAVVDTAEKKIYSESAGTWGHKDSGKILAIPSDEIDADGEDEDSLLHMV